MSAEINDLLFRTVLGGIRLKDDVLEKLTQAAQDLAQTVAKDPKLMVPIALNAFLPDGSTAALDVVRQGITQQWKAFASQVPDGGLPYLRAVSILALLEHASDDRLGSALYLLLADPLSRQGEAREAELRDHVLTLLLPTYQRASEAAWIAVDIDIPAISAKAPTPVKLSADVSTATQGAITQALTGSMGSYQNGYGPIHVQPSAEWATPVSKTVVEAVGTLLQHLLTPVTTAVVAPLKDMSKFGSVIGESLKAATLAERRMNVMWWMQARYSPSLEVPYRTIGPYAAAFRMAYDLDDVVPNTAPKEVQAVLVEAWHMLFSEDTPEPLFGALKSVASSDREFKDAKASATPGHMDLIAAIHTVAASPKLTQRQLGAMTGVAGNTPVSGSDFALWVFRVYQARRILS